MTKNLPVKGGISPARQDGETSPIEHDRVPPEEAVSSIASSLLTYDSAFASASIPYLQSMH